jgi:hypothetical protein
LNREKIFIRFLGVDEFCVLARCAAYQRFETNDSVQSADSAIRTVFSFPDIDACALLLTIQ